MKIAICTMAINEWYRKIVKYCLKNIEQYAKKYNYDFHLFQDEIYDGKRDCPWYKIKAIESILHKYDFVLWIDADGFISKFELDINFFLNFLKNKDILCGKDFNSTLNTGVMLIKNTPFVHSLLYEVWNNKQYFDSNFHEQASMGQIYDTNKLNSKTKIEILPLEQQYVLFSYWANYYPNRSFFIHIARCAFDPIGFVYTLDCYCPLKMDEDKEGEYEDRINWLNDAKKCRGDIENWIKGKQRSRASTRSILYKQEFENRNLEKQN